MFTAGIVFFAMFFSDVPFWLIAMAIICDTFLLVMGIEKL